MAIDKNNSQEMIKKTLSYRFVVFGVIAVAYLFVYFHRMSTAVMAPLLTADFGVDSVAVGLFGSMYFYAYALAQLPAGILVDNWGVRKTTSLFILIAGVATILFALAGSFRVALISRFLVGMGVAYIYISSLRIIADWFKKDEYSTFVTFLVGIGNLGGLAASAPLAALIAVFNWRSTMMSIGVITLIIGVLLYIFVRNKPADIGGLSMAAIEKLPVVFAPAMSVKETFKLIFKKYNYWTIIVIFFIWAGTILGFQGLWAGPYLMSVYHLSQAEAGNIIMFIALGAIIGCPLSGIIADRIIKTKKKVMIIGMIGNLLTWLPFVIFTDSMSIVLIKFLMFSFGFFGYFHVITWANLKENVDLVMLGTASGLVNFCGFFGGAFFQQLLGVIIKVASFKIAFLVCLLSLLAGFAFYLTQKEPSVN